MPSPPGGSWAAGSSNRSLGTVAVKGPRLEGNSVGIAERQAESVGVLGNASVFDPEFLQPLLPPLDFISVRASKTDVIKPGSELIKGMIRVRRAVDGSR